MLATRRVFPSFILLLALAGASPASAQQTTILCFGDSITWGLNRFADPAPSGSAADGYLPHLSRFLTASWGEVVMVNAGLEGETTSEGRARIGSALGAAAPDLVLIMEGTNDVTHIWQDKSGDAGIAATVQNLDAIGNAAQSAGAQPILATIIPRWKSSSSSNNGITRNLNKSIRQLAKTRGWVLVDQEANFLPHEGWEIYSDDFHPNLAGYELMAEEWGAEIASYPRNKIDLVQPYLWDAVPAPDSKDGEPGDPIRLELKDLGTGMDRTTLSLTVNGAAVLPAVDGSDDDLHLFYLPAVAWTAGQVVEVAVGVQDRASPPNVTHTTYSFVINPGNGTLGDIDVSGRVEGHDLVLLGLAFGATKKDARYDVQADIDLNDLIDGNDLAILASHFGERL